MLLEGRIGPFPKASGMTGNTDILVEDLDSAGANARFHLLLNKPMVDTVVALLDRYMIVDADRGSALFAELIRLRRQRAKLRSVEFLEE
jgi:hypothetical protein